MSNYTDLRQRTIGILDAISRPAAPYYEGHVRNAIYNLLAPLREYPQVQITQDRYGNLIARYRHPDARYSASLAAVAHMDHPGYHLESATGKNAVASIQGGLPRDQRLPGSSMLVFHGDLTNRGVIQEFKDKEKKQVIVELEEPWRGDLKHVWGVPDVDRFHIEGDYIHGRAMDDLAGCAQEIVTLELLVREAVPVEYTAVFTRAEEVGFVGAVGACELKSIPQRAVVLSLEASKNLEGARPGDGIILRTGDRQSVFDIVVTELLEQAGNEAVSSGYPYQKKRMDGGTCEAALYVSYGYETGALAVPLINYHNQGENGVAAEAIHSHDLVGGVAIQTELAKILAETKRVPREFFREHRKAHFINNMKLLLDSNGA